MRMVIRWLLKKILKLMVIFSAVHRKGFKKLGVLKLELFSMKIEFNFNNLWQVIIYGRSYCNIDTTILQRHFKYGCKDELRITPHYYVIRALNNNL